MTLRTCVLLVALHGLGGVGLWPTIAAAEPIDEAKAAFADGKIAFERGEYENALAQFQKANAIAPAPNLHFAIGKTYEALGRYREAAGAFEKYLQTYGTPQNDDDKQFQENLRARIAADRARPERGPPSSPSPSNGPPPYPPTYYPPQGVPPNYYQYYPYPPRVAYQASKGELLLEARARRSRAIALIVIGALLDAIGIGVSIDGYYRLSPTFDNAAAGVEIFIGVSAAITGIPLWATGAASFVKSSRRLREVNLMPDTPAPTGAMQSQIFSLPAFHF